MRIKGILYYFWSLVHKHINVLSRKVEGIDPVKPWQPFKLIKKVLHSTNVSKDILDR